MTDMLLHFYKALMGFGLAAAIVWVLTPAVSELARRMGVMDEPEARKIHAYPTPRLGGIALFVGVIVPALLLLSSEPANRGILLGAALVVGVCGIRAITFAVIALSLGRFDMGILAAVVAGSTIGFLWHNFHPASIFMGDSGSLLLGYLLAAVSLQGFLKGVATVALLIPLLVLSIPIFDTGFAILRRVKNRQPIYLADRGHIHHRFTNLGYSHRKTVIIIYCWSATMSVVALCMRFAPVWVTGMAAAVAGVVSFFIAYRLEILRWDKLLGSQLRGDEE